MLSEEFKKAVTAYEKGRQKSIDYWMKNTEEAIPLGDKFYTIDKPRIETSFCFGYGFCGMSSLEDEKNASDMAKYAKEEESYFIEKNMEDIEGEIKRLEEKNRYWYVGSSCYNENRPFTDISSSKSVPFYDEEGKLHNMEDYHFITYKRLLTEEEKQAILEAYKRVRASFEKRLKTYLKRYGLSKIRTWSYLVD